MIAVESSAGRYEIHCRWGALDDLGALMRDAGLAGPAFVISDENTGELFGARALASLRTAGIEAQCFSFPAGEASKDLATVSRVYDWLIEQRAERKSPIVALGGGVVGDLVGFVAATFLRGVPFVQAPTSLLAMVDAAIGGKTGVDHERGKNLIGAFYPPRLVVEDTSLLTSLPARALRDGFAEAIKHGFIRDPGLLDIMEREAERLLAVEPELTTAVVVRNAQLKAEVVSQDEREADLRMILNYGHTTAHAIEAVTGYTSVTHGEADSVGMMAAAAIGERVGLTPSSVAERQRRLFGLYGLPLRLSGIDVDAIMKAMMLDKKATASRLRWVLLEDEGRPVIRDDVPRQVVREVLTELLR